MKHLLALPFLIIGIIAGFIKESVYAGYLYGISVIEKLGQESNK
jgi:membrane protease YdiL (CAAX protease family)